MYNIDLLQFSAFEALSEFIRKSIETSSICPRNIIHMAWNKLYTVKATICFPYDKGCIEYRTKLRRKEIDTVLTSGQKLTICPGKGQQYFHVDK